MEENVKIDWLEKTKHDKERGYIDISGERHTIVHSDAFKSYREAIAEIIGHGADAVLYLAGKRHTENFVKIMLKKSTMAGFISKFGWGRSKIAEKIVDILNDYGFGAGVAEKIDLDGETVIIVKNSCIAGSYKKKQKLPVCSYLAGLLAGGANAVAGGDFNCIETHCTAKGDKHCRFVIKPEKKSFTV